MKHRKRKSERGNNGKEQISKPGVGGGCRRISKGLGGDGWGGGTSMLYGPARIPTRKEVEGKGENCNEHMD